MNIRQLLITVATAIAVTSVAQAEQATILSEDFDALTEGTETAPASAEISTNGAVETSLTHGNQWKGRGLHAAGGTMAVLHFDQTVAGAKESTQGYIETPMTDVRLDDGRFTLSFRARATGNATATLHVEIYDPYTTNSVDATTLEIGDTWKQYQVTLQHPGYGNHLAYAQIASDGDDWLIDDFAIIQEYAMLMPPIAHYARNVSYTQFTANWNAVPMATGYLLSAFSIENGKRQYILDNEPVDGCEYTVTGTVEGTDYYYTVRSTNQLYTSAETSPIQVHVPLLTLDTPVGLCGEGVHESGFTARWEPVRRAMGYIVTLQRSHTTTGDEVSVILHEDFDKFGGSALSSSPFYGNLDDYTSMPGWKASDWQVSASGKFGFDNRWKQYEGLGFLTSPSLDLSGNDGHFAVTVKVTATRGKNVTATCGNTTLSHTLTTTTEQFSFNFDCGTADSKIKLSYDGDGTILFDDIVISQTMPAGQKVLENIGTYNTVDATSGRPTGVSPTEYTFSELTAVEGDSFIYTVTAWSWSLGEDGVWGPTIYSQASEPCMVSMNSGISSPTATDGTRISIRNNAIEVYVGTTTAMSVYDASGAQVGQYTVHPGYNSVPCHIRGVVIVRVGDTVRKLMVR